MKRSLYFILFFLYPLFTSIALYPLLATTPITTVHQELKAVEDLQASELVISFDFDQKNFSQSAIQVISSSVEPYALIIHTDQADFCCSPEQLFYDYQTESFIPAFKLDSSSILISKEGDLYQCIDIEIKEGWTTFYEIHLKKPHTFFAFDQQILMHNMNAASSTFAPLTEWLFGTGVAIFCGYFGKQWEHFTEFHQARDYLNSLIKSFSDRCQKMLDEKKDIFFCDKTISQTKSNQLFSINVNQELYNQLQSHPFLYGPLCCIATMRSDGNVDCALYVFKFERRDLKTNTDLFSWNLLGSTAINRDHQLVKDFVAHEDAQELNKLKQFVQTWPMELKTMLASFRTTITKQTIVKRVDDAFFERTLNTLRIGIHAIFNMARKNIPSSLIQYVLHHGQTLQAHYSDRSIIIDHEHKIAVAQEKPSLKILNVGFLAHDMPQLNPPVPKNLPPKESAENKKQDENIKTVENILKDAQKQQKSAGAYTTQYEKTGGIEQALKDFESLGVKDIFNIPTGKSGILPDGRQINVRTKSKEGRVTVEIQEHNSKRAIKVRYS